MALRSPDELGQRVVVATRSKNFCADVFSVEEEQLLKGLGDHAERQEKPEG